MPRWATFVLAVAAAAFPGCGRLGYGSGNLGARDGGAPGMDGSRGAVCGDGEVQGVEICDDGNTVPGDGCSANCLARELCGDGEVTTGEACDDGNGVDADGCRNDCTFSCTDDPGCDDGLVCNGVETCDVDVHRCELGAPATDGTSCGGGDVCRGGSCAPTTCGDGNLDAGEECDDENLVDGDGCDNDCTLSCVDAGDCDDGRPCNGLETCEANVCLEPDVFPVPGTPCDRDADPGTRDICLFLDCRRSTCGDGFTDPMTSPPEECDDDNVVNGDGCDNDCTFSCESPADCDDSNVCNGTEGCSDHQCIGALVAPADGTPCVGGRCSGGSCVPIGRDGGFSLLDGGSVIDGASLPPLPDSGGLCPDPPTTTMPIECFRRCVVEEECTIVSTDCCCSCAAGGGWEAISTRFVPWWALACGSCGGRMCLDVYLCPGPPSCIDGMCQASSGGAS